jgi:3-hydroxypropanoate dehydrogenase
MGSVISADAMDVLFRTARTHGAWLDKPVSDELLRQVWDLAKWGPTSMNTMPVRVVFVKSPEGKARLLPGVMAGNVEKVKAAPVTAIVAYDMKFYEFMPKLWPHGAKMADMFAGNPAMTAGHVMRNGTLGGAYLIVAARALGLDTGPMSGFHNDKVDAEFFPDGRWKSNFLCNLGYGDAAKLHPRGPRLDFDEACRIV